MVLERYIDVTTPLGDGPDGAPALQFEHLIGSDRLSAPFRYELTLQSEDPEIASDKLLGEAMSITIKRSQSVDEAPRFFHGIVDQFSYRGNESGGRFQYRLILRPSFWFLSKTMDNRIFQRMSVPDIVSQVLDDAGMSDYRLELSGSYPEREYCVQYGESNLDFVQRLLEHEGIFYYFEFDDGAHTMVICDKLDSLKDAPACEELKFEQSSQQRTGEQDIISRIERIDTASPAKWVHTDYDFEKPSADLMTTSDMSGWHTNDDKERYSYPGKYIEHGRGADLSDLRVEEGRALSQVIHANSTAIPPCSGQSFSLVGSLREADNIKFVILKSSYEIWEGQYAAGLANEEQEQGFKAQYELIPADTFYRPARLTPKPVMRGPQTAVVVGPSGEEIHTDEYARVKVQFHWDRKGERNQNSTCFIRVSSVWAGSGWGFIQIPRIGQEVIVDFLEGDPDQPIITGRVYNAEQMPPYELPANATQSGWKSNSSLGGGGWNEMRFEDKKGEEEVYFQAEKDHNELVKNNESRTIGNDFLEDIGNDATQNVHHDRTETVDNNKSTTVGVDRTVSIGSNDTETVGSNRSLTVGSDETIQVGLNSTESIGLNHSQTVGVAQTITVGAARVDSVGAAETRQVGGPQNNTIGGPRAVSVGMSQSHTIGASDSWTISTDQSLTIGSSQTVQIGKDQSIETGGARLEKVAKSSVMEIGEDFAIKVGKDLIIEAGDTITIKVGKAAISMKKDGTINIEGKDITLKGSGKVDVKASKDITMKGKNINQN
ncbi:type VI secretion system tip protein VgrG [Rhodobacteraceae bacterium LMO-12]|nr:type VI secretion system tip protein VgrG [Rhodobacteraceae bacterium LMO-JJ12]